METMNFIAENWYMGILAFAIIAIVIITIYRFIKMPNSVQKEKVRQCLLGWVIEAEKQLGGGTGKVKLSLVYSWFVTAFPFLKIFVTLDMFNTWVDEVLVEMRKMLEINSQLKSVVAEK